ncbi:hypothetical protein [Alicycliphilus denitrificans]|uniref:hypothetical protein n=1 Tax=Alicycliphilus denitrificans TaxID=179636 RepID=UPI0011C48F87|nr:hypothetical protein [Alicycliphilus denitrificans]
MRHTLRPGENRNDGGVLHGPILSIVDPARQWLIRSGGSLTDHSISWSRSLTFEVTSLTTSSLGLALSISNLGDAPSVNASITLVIWGVEERQVATFRSVTSSPIPPAQVTGPGIPAGNLLENISFGLDELLYGAGASKIVDASTITHVFAVVHDAPLDMPDKISTDLVQRARKGEKYFGPGNVHPCRLSHKIACTLPIPKGAFSVVGNQVNHAIAGYSDIFITQVDAGLSAHFGILSPVKVLLLGDLKGKGVSGPHFSSNLLVAGDLQFYLEQQGQVLSSSDQNNADVSIAPSNGDCLMVNWSDTGGDRDKGDFVVTVCHR